MAIRSRVVEDVAVMVAIVVGMPLVGMLFLAVLYYCCLEWLHYTLVSRQWLPTKPMRTIAANP
jgi:hypothetical protein